MAQEDKPQQTQEVSKAEPGGVMASLNHYVASEEGQQETLENTPLRVLGYFGRLGRVFGRVLAKGSRYVAFSSDVGEAFRPVVDPKYVRLGYGIAIAYVVADVGLVTYHAHKHQEDVTRAFSKQLTFQVFGSLLLPSVIIHQGVHFSEKTFKKMGRFQKWGPVFAGLGIIPFMPMLIDEPVEHVVDMAFDRFWPEEGKFKSKHE
eukprot:CAMPEP_0171526244 /NCGR_PEP_ID=MMETSP0959-20130129/10272_1 /TAXON_ID=87120 /ORGANISM="Aurantiochytrium limacinum, Strain ATCCMYA-1381" /LENGTH=203 /DNA_ID=CAMNT_0012067619 /DNA_START=113 /DNA_END=724 /DNA_ORIENTATION=+